MSDLSITTDQLFNAGVAFFSALVGGGLSLVGSYWTLNRAHRLDRARDLENEKRKRARDALSAFFKLLDTYNCASNYKRQIDEMLDEAKAAGRADVKVWQKVRPLVGRKEVIELITTDEIAFLLDAKQGQLISRARLVQTRVASIVENMNLYKRLHAEMNEKILLNATEIEKTDALRASAVLEGKLGLHVELMSEQVSNLIYSIIDHLKADQAEAEMVTKEFKQAAENFFGDDYPKFKLEFEDDA